jgi:hypothetical protein
MTTLISSIVRVGRRRPAGMAGRRVGALAVSLLAAGSLTAGCGSAHAGQAASGGKASSALASSGKASRVAPGPATVAAAPATSAATVPTISYKPPLGGVACAGWPTHATSASLPVSFVPVSVERCVSGLQTIPGKGLWATATLQRADSGLTVLVDALRRPSAGHRPGTLCPAIAVIPPQIVLISASGQKLIPRLPVSGCGLVQSQVLAALNQLHWQTVSVRLIARVPAATPSTVSGTAPRSIQTVSGVQPQ